MAYRLFVARDKKDAHRHDVGSVLCINLANALNDSVSIDVVECRKSTPGLPEWLTGTPTIQNMTSRELFRGHEAVSLLQQLSIACAEERGANRKKNAPGANRTRPSPGVQLRPPDHTHATPDTPASAHGAWGEAEEDGGEQLWESRIDESEEADATETRKLSSEDLSRAVQERSLPTHQDPGPQQPPLPPIGE